MVANTSSDDQGCEETSQRQIFGRVYITDKLPKEYAERIMEI